MKKREKIGMRVSNTLNIENETMTRGTCFLLTNLFITTIISQYSQEKNESLGKQMVEFSSKRLKDNSRRIFRCQADVKAEYDQKNCDALCCLIQTTPRKVFQSLSAIESAIESENYQE